MNAKLEARSCASRRRVGMLTPSSNTVLEPATARLLAPMEGRVTAHFSRFRVLKIALDEDADGQFAQGPILEAAKLLADARCDVIAWNGTSASWLGFDEDVALCRAIEAETGIAATSAILALNALLDHHRVRRLALVTPYTADVQRRIAKNYEAAGFHVVGETHAGLSDNFAFADVSEDRIEAMIRDVATSRPDAIAIVCTNMNGPFVAARLEHELGIPIFDSVAFTLQGCLRVCKVPTRPLAKFGRMFESALPVEA